MRANTIKYEAFVLGVALFRSLVAGEGAFMAGCICRWCSARWSC